MKRCQVPLSMLFRLVAVLSMAWMIHHHHLRVNEAGQRPVRLSEVRAVLPDTHKLALNTAPERGWIIHNSEGEKIGSVQRTMPDCRAIKGYSGPSDVLMVFNAEELLQGIAIRHSYDTPSHLKDVTDDYLFMEQWNGLTHEQLAAKTEVDVVSGATRTSEAVAQSLSFRAGVGFSIQPVKPAFVFRWHDAALMLLSAIGLFLAFSKNRKLHRRKMIISFVMVLYLGIISGDLLAQSLLLSRITHGIPWRTLPGLVFLAAIAFLVPWSSGKPVYCTHICPHGQVQRWLIKWIPARRRKHLDQDSKWGLSALPGALLILVLLVSFLKLPLDLAGIEPFDAWIIRGAGVATLVVAGVGLLFSAFVPMGYCRYACPTGLALSLVRKSPHGFVRHDYWLGALWLITAGLYVSYPLWQKGLLP